VSATHASELLRDGLLDGVTIALAGVEPGALARSAELGEPYAHATRNGCEALGARVLDLPLVGQQGAALDEAAVDAAVERLLDQAGSVEMLVVDGAALFAHGSGRAALVGSLEASWNATRALVNRAFMPAQPSPPGGRIVYLAPAPDAREHADAARAGLENLARTLSIEWARHAITLVAIAPAADTSAGEVATLVAYLASPAGAYFSGCLLDLTGPGGS
jgi:NAD(P)-dependent dehydrogenase (short-subunit alcohol dehydrogenase family)